MKTLKQFLSVVLDKDEITDNDADGVSITPHGWNWTGYTIYPKGNNRYTVYAAEPDLRHCVDVADEKWLMEGGPFAVQSFFRGALNRPIDQDRAEQILGKKAAEKFFQGIEIGFQEARRAR